MPSAANIFGVSLFRIPMQPVRPSMKGVPSGTGERSLQSGAQRRREACRDTEPGSKSRYGLVHEHAPPAPGAMTSLGSRLEQSGLERIVDNIGDSGVAA